MIIKRKTQQDDGISALQVAEFFLSLDPRRELFDTTLMERNGRTFYAGNARLNKYLHLAQNIYLAKTGKPLMNSTFYAYDNGAVVPSVQEKYSVLLNRHREITSLPDDIQVFLKKFFVAFKNASVDELIELSHEDSEWEAKHGFYSKERQQMDTLSHIDEYKEQYQDIVTVLDGMVLDGT